MRRWIFIVLLTLSLLGCTSARPSRTVRLNVTTPDATVLADASPEIKPILVGAASIISPGETIRTYGPFFKYLERKIGLPIELVHRKTYEETYELLRSGTLDLALVCTYIYTRGHEEIGLELLGAPEVNGMAKYQSLIIVPADSDIRSFDDLQNRHFAYTDPLSTSGYLYPMSLIRAKNISPGRYFSSTTYTYSHDGSIRAVVQGLVAGAAIDSLVFDQWVRDNPDQSAKLRVIDRSEYFPSPPMVASNRLDPEVRDAFRQALLDMHEDPEGRSILSKLGVDRFVAQRDEEYASVRALASRAGVRR